MSSLSGRAFLSPPTDSNVGGRTQEPHPLQITPSTLPEIFDIGITTIWAPEDSANIEADICFIHGLGGHPLTTWQYKTRQEKKDMITRVMQYLRRKLRNDKTDWTGDGVRVEGISACYWPFDLLRKDFQNIRILSYGYDSNPTHWYRGSTTQMTIDQHTQTLLQKVSDYREGCPARPIIFVAHSLGGILVKNLLIESRKYGNLDGNSALHDIYTCCHAIVFFGTPHRGASSAELGSMVANAVGVLPVGPSIYKGILKNLQPDSEKLVSIMKDFNDILARNVPAPERIQVYSFREGKGYAKISMFDHKVVPDGSSTFDINRAIERSSFIPENHMDMCRFKTHSDSGYVDFKNALSTYLGAIKERKRLTTAPVGQDVLEEKDMKDIINSLDFHERMVLKYRLEEIETQKETFEWIWTSEFKSWLESSTSLFWISGKPASGKSTLMAHISSNKQVSKLLRSSLDEEWKILYHFFDFRAGDGMRNNIDGLLRTLVLQLCKCFLECRNQVALWFSKSDWDKQTQHWPRADLRSALEIARKAAPSPILLLIDGLDEFQGDHQGLCCFLRELASPRSKVCVASRPDPTYSQYFENDSSIKMDRLNEPGIRSFTGHLLSDFRISADGTHDQRDFDFVQEITSRANGVFLWARFAVTEIVDGKSRGEMAMQLQERLDQIPDDLKDIYSRIFKRMTALEKIYTSHVLLIVLYAIRALSVQQMYVAMSMHSFSGTYPTLQWPSIPAKPNYSAFCKRILASSGGLLEILDKKRNSSEVEDLSSQKAFGRSGIDSNLEASRHKIVQIIHRTLKSYLEEHGWVDLGIDGTELVQPHYHMIRVCTRLLQSEYSELESQSLKRMNVQSPPYLALGDHKPATESQAVSDRLAFYEQVLKKQNSADTVHDLLIYAIQQLPTHAYKFEENTKVSSYELLKDILTDAYAHAHVRLSNRHSCDYCSNLRPDTDIKRNHPDLYSYVDPPLCLVISHGLTLFFMETISQNNSNVWKCLKPSMFKNLEQQLEQDRMAIRHILRGFQDIGGPAALAALAARDANVHDTRILEICLELNPFHEKYIFREALKHYPARFIQVLSDHYRKTSGDVALAFEFDAIFWRFPEELNKPHCYRPLWYIAQRYPSLENGKIIDFFLEQGEDINGPCGPTGTVIHAICWNAFQRPGWRNVPILKEFIRRGADVNAQGPYGRPLEYLRKLMQTPGYPDSKPGCTTVMLVLIEFGAVNRKRDPDANVPSVE